jgi:hypothetical protein
VKGTSREHVDEKKVVKWARAGMRFGSEHLAKKAATKLLTARLSHCACFKPCPFFKASAQASGNAQGHL